MMPVVAIGQCLQVTVIILCKYIVSFHNSQQRRHVTVWHASQERALHTILLSNFKYYVLAQQKQRCTSSFKGI